LMPKGHDKLIISASRRTDIPAFYSEWFINRIRAGFFIKVNPYNPKQRKEISLLPSEVAAIVFWSKDPQPLLEYLGLLDQMNYNYLFQFTLNNYSRILEPRVPPLKERLATFLRLSDRIGPDKVLWRYDPIIVSNLNSVEDHLEQFQQIAKQLTGYTRQVTVSLVALYDKVQANFKKLTLKAPFRIINLRAAEEREQLSILAKGLSQIAWESKLRIFSCSEKVDLSEWNISAGSCIDARLINELFQLDLKVAKDKYQRPECGCVSSVDMGCYDTCNFGCSYCYANTSMKTVFRQVDFSAPTLLG
jgi:DNA repair photolyase